MFGPIANGLGDDLDFRALFPRTDEHRSTSGLIRAPKPSHTSQLSHSPKPHFRKKTGSLTSTREKKLLDLHEQLHRPKPTRPSITNSAFFDVRTANNLERIKELIERERTKYYRGVNNPALSKPVYRKPVYSNPGVVRQPRPFKTTSKPVQPVFKNIVDYEYDYYYDDKDAAKAKRPSNKPSVLGFEDYYYEEYEEDLNEFYDYDDYSTSRRHGNNRRSDKGEKPDYEYDYYAADEGIISPTQQKLMNALKRLNGEGRNATKWTTPKPRTDSRPRTGSRPRTNSRPRSDSRPKSFYEDTIMNGQWPRPAYETTTGKFRFFWPYFRFLVKCISCTSFFSLTPIKEVSDNGLRDSPF